jgi:hypothetical protein
LEYWSDGRTTEISGAQDPEGDEDNGEGGPREKKILVRNGANYREMVQIGARLHWLTVELAILIFDWEEEACLTLIRTNFHEF